jgi:hypothetical protein
MTLPMPSCTCVPHEPNNPECAAHGVCSCNDPDSWGACPLHVPRRRRLQSTTLSATRTGSAGGVSALAQPSSYAWLFTRQLGDDMT